MRRLRWGNVVAQNENPVPVCGELPTTLTSVFCEREFPEAPEEAEDALEFTSNYAGYCPIFRPARDEDLSKPPSVSVVEDPETVSACG